mmetsp:Transcript_4906/g.13186  ORF Transcript_4906/g.13186 Transcript_4906/m.13186 type:complete len:81 (+) Transcript_4906:465-707(+)
MALASKTHHAVRLEHSERSAPVLHEQLAQPVTEKFGRLLATNFARLRCLRRLRLASQEMRAGYNWIQHLTDSASQSKIIQ